MQIFADGLMRAGLAGQDEAAASGPDRGHGRLAGEQIVAETDRAQRCQARAAPAQPAPGGSARAVLSRSPVLGGDEPGRQRQHLRMAGGEKAGAEEAVEIFLPPVGAAAMQAARAVDLARAERLVPSSAISSWRMGASVGMRSMPNRLWQLARPWPSSDRRWWARNDGLPMKNREKADRTMSAMRSASSRSFPLRGSGRRTETAPTAPMRSGRGPTSASVQGSLGSASGVCGGGAGGGDVGPKVWWSGPGQKVRATRS